MGLSLNVVYDASVNSAPAQFKTAVAAVVQYFESIFTDPITITIDVDARRLDIALDDEEIVARVAAHTVPGHRDGVVLEKYARVVSSASEGAITW